MAQTQAQTGAATKEMTGKPLIESDRVEGTTVYDPRGNDIGNIKRLMIDKISGRVAYAVMTFGGFLGIGADEHAIRPFLAILSMTGGTANGNRSCTITIARPITGEPETLGTNRAHRCGHGPSLLRMTTRQEIPIRSRKRRPIVLAGRSRPVFGKTRSSRCNAAIAVRNDSLGPSHMPARRRGAQGNLSPQQEFMRHGQAGNRTFYSLSRRRLLGLQILDHVPQPDPKSACPASH
jgi:hypothetical protein